MMEEDGGRRGVRSGRDSSAQAVFLSASLKRLFITTCVDLPVSEDTNRALNLLTNLIFVFPSCWKHNSVVIFFFLKLNQGHSDYGEIGARLTHNVLPEFTSRVPVNQLPWSPE